MKISIGKIDSFAAVARHLLDLRDQVERQFRSRPNWTADAGVPSPDDGDNGDFYINTSTRDLYKKVAGAWVLQVTL